MAARNAHRELVAESEDRVVRAARLDPAQRQARPLGELVGQKPAHERLVDVELVDMHPGRHRRASIRRHAATSASVPLPGFRSMEANLGELGDVVDNLGAPEEVAATLDALSES